MLHYIPLAVGIIDTHSVAGSEKQYSESGYGSEKSGNMMCSDGHFLYLEVDQEEYNSSHRCAAHILICPTRKDAGDKHENRKNNFF